ncbi:Xaa-Pro peptidase family protein [Sphingomonas sp. LY160]|uniref:M24 family metallopeptidase n=1 Tax=Sphingomonas sp. LY160 TaxID=3095342 RepID=UPI002ADEB5AA|nr:Xaa-Pro peptidase family protein [Sphingomonas sp. LY160]MEA1071312.1 Xaa-Pro peptidase family protein [Sphingomonas sp. LY160]
MARLSKARRLMEREGLGAIIIEPGASLDYFTGVRWSRSERLTAAVIPVSGPPLIVTPFFEKPSVAESLQIDADIRTWDEHEEPLRTVAGILHETKVAGQPIGIEETNRFFIVDRLKQQYPKAVTRNANGVVRGCRMIKSPAELALMQAASDITLDAIREMHGKLKAGMTPDDISTLLEQGMVSRGGSSPWALVLIGEAAAYPHGSGKPQILRPGEILLVDTGCAVRGYQADISRTFVFGAAPTADQRRVWEQVAQGQKIAMQAARIGVTAGSVDDAVRAAYTRWGYGPDYKLPGLSHRTGHGIGMEGHEPINLVRGEATTLAPGMCFSNEPGIYIPGKFGVRLEDCFHMTTAGPKWFSVPPASIDDPFGRSGA